MRADGQKPDMRRERGASGPVVAKPISIKDAERRFGGDARKAVELTSGDLFGVPKLGLRVTRAIRIAEQESAKGIVPAKSGEGPNGVERLKGRGE